MNTKKLNNRSRRSAVRRTVLAAAIAAGFGLTGQVMAQATTSSIFGSVPIAAGETVQITGGAGFNRTVPVDSTGHYSITVPIGTYTVNLMQNGQVIQSKSNVTPAVAGATAVNFTSAAAKGGENANAKSLSAVTVTANETPAIDVASTRQSLVITAEQLKHLPLARSGEAIALLAPGTVEGSPLLATNASPTGQPYVSFGGASIAENAYYVNGFNSSDPLGNQGGITLPYGSIAQQQTITSGYGAEYGRSAGGVISEVGKSGTNDWHFGAQALWQPAFARSTSDNYYYANPLSKKSGQQVGDLYQYRQPNKSWETVYDAYVGGPLIKDRLFFFISAEVDKTQATANRSLSAKQIDQFKVSQPKLYAKLDWNINDSNILSLTGIQSKDQNSGSQYFYDNVAHQSTGFAAYDPSTKNSFGIWIAKYTAYITDDLTVDAMYGKLKGTYFTMFPGSVSSPLPFIANPNQQNITLPGVGPNGNTNAQPLGQVGNSGHQSSTSNLRLDLDWKLGHHDVQFGIDNQTTSDIGDGSLTTGPGYQWVYSNTPGMTGTGPNQSPWVDDPANYPNGVGSDGNTYSVSKSFFLTAASVKVKQKAEYIQDNWQVSDNLLLNLGLRNDQFTNLNALGKPYLRLTHGQWAPRLGFSWDVLGDASLKVFGNIGRYYLALPTSVALREASASTFYAQYYTYAGIDANGIPQGLTPINSRGQTLGPGVPVSANNEYGQALDANVVHSTNIKAEYQDEIVLGMQQQINPSWVYGVQGMYRRLGTIIDDVADQITECNQLVAQNPSKKAQLDAQGAAADAQYDPTNPCAAPPDLGIQGSVLINPGSTNTFTTSNGQGGYNHFTVSPAQFGFPKTSRKYYSLEAYLEHPFDGKWQGKLDYVFSKSYGSTDGPVQSNIGQGGSSVSITTQWDFGSLMQYANGVQANSRKHVLKAYGSYQLTPEWIVSGVLTLASGTPRTCLGYLGPNEQDPTTYGSFYHWCGGKPAPGGSTGYTPWIHPLNLSVEYRPEWADKKLGFQLQVRNVFNEQNALQYYPYFGKVTQFMGAPYSPNPSYGRTEGNETPRTVQVGVTYDW